MSRMSIMAARRPNPILWVTGQSGTLCTTLCYDSCSVDSGWRSVNEPLEANKDKSNGFLFFVFWVFYLGNVLLLSYSGFRKFLIFQRTPNSDTPFSWLLSLFNFRQRVFSEGRNTSW